MATERKREGLSGFLGVGWSFPPDFDAARGVAIMSTDEQDIEASLRILLGTSAGERVRHPTYGLNLQELLFEPMNTTMQTLLKDRIKTTLLVYEPRINVLAIDLNPARLNEGCLEIGIEYVIRATNSRFNLVFPFYVNEATEAAGPEGLKGR
jgi:hypothetical protein